MARTPMTREALTAWIQDQMAQEPECRGIAFDGSFTTLRVEEPGGCNWDLSLLRNCNEYGSVCWERLNRVLELAKGQFTLA